MIYELLTILGLPRLKVIIRIVGVTYIVVQKLAQFLYALT